MSIYRTMSEFLNGARILETRKELMRLGWSAERANGWLLKNMVFAVSAKSGKRTVASGVRDASPTSGVTAKSVQPPSNTRPMFSAPIAKRDFLRPTRSDAGGVNSICGGQGKKDLNTWYAEQDLRGISQKEAE